MPGLRDTTPFLAFGGKIDPISEIRNAGIVTNGSVFWVKPSSDADYTTLQFTVGQSYLYPTIQGAVNAARNDKNDYVLITGPDNNAAYDIGTSLNLNKNTLHVYGIGYDKVAQNYAVTIRGFGTTTIDTQMVHVTGGGVEMAGVRIFGTTGTNANGTMTGGYLRVGTASTGTGHDFYLHDSTIESGVSGVANGTPALVATPGTVHSARFDNVSFLVPNDTLEKAHAGLVALGNGGKRWVFNNCYFEVFAGSTADRFITAGTGAKLSTVLNNCIFAQIGTVAMASGVVGSTTVGNPIMLSYCTWFGTVTQAGTDPSTYKAPVESGTSTAVRDLGIAVGTAALIPA